MTEKPRYCLWCLEMETKVVVEGDRTICIDCLDRLASIALRGRAALRQASREFSKQSIASELLSEARVHMQRAITRARHPEVADNEHDRVNTSVPMTRAMWTKVSRLAEEVSLSTSAWIRQAIHLAFERSDINDVPLEVVDAFYHGDIYQGSVYCSSCDLFFVDHEEQSAMTHLEEHGGRARYSSDKELVKSRKLYRPPFLNVYEGGTTPSVLPLPQSWKPRLRPETRVVVVDAGFTKPWCSSWRPGEPVPVAEEKKVTRPE